MTPQNPLLDVARKILADARATPAPLAGVLNLDVVLANKIASVIAEREQTLATYYENRIKQAEQQAAATEAKARSIHQELGERIAFLERERDQAFERLEAFKEKTKEEAAFGEGL